MSMNRRPPVRVYSKPIVVPEDLDILTGLTSGVVELPRHLKWSGSKRYNLDQPGRIADLYRTVLNEASTPQDLAQFLDRATLLELWPSMWLPSALRRRWEDRFPELAMRRREPAA